MNGVQLGIDFEARRLSRASDPFTSHEAAERVREFAAGHCAMILQSLIDHGPMICDEIARHTGLLSHQINKRVTDLERQGLASTTGETRSSDSGRQARVWRAA